MEERKAYAKINLTLEILEKRADGYHEMRSLMQKVSLCDTLYFEPLCGDMIEFSCDRNVCPTEDNIAYKAILAYRKHYQECTGKTFGLSVSLHKNIPDKAGLAGGSADCACVLDYLFETFGGVPDNTSDEIAASLGSDINFCLKKHSAAVCTGRGITVENIKPLEAPYLLICVPSFGMKTGEIYAAFDSDPVLASSNVTENMRRYLEDNDITSVKQGLFNAFAPLCEKRCADISSIKALMTQYGGASEMSGSGSAVFAIFDDDNKRQSAYRILIQRYPQSYLCASISSCE